MSNLSCQQAWGPAEVHLSMTLYYYNLQGCYWEQAEKNFPAGHLLRVLVSNISSKLEVLSSVQHSF